MIGHVTVIWRKNCSVSPAPPWILIDGYNLLHASGVFGSGGRTSLESSREALLDWLGAVLSDAQRKRTTIVFDAKDAPPGLPRSARKHDLRIRFAPRGGEADEVLEELIRDHSVPRKLIVVSSDHRLHRAARRRRATAVDSDRWVSELKHHSVDEVVTPEHDEARGPDDTRIADRDPEDEALERWLEQYRED
jgi:predicted RNA-binding protein with PIN domain